MPTSIMTDCAPRYWPCWRSASGSPVQVTLEQGPCPEKAGQREPEAPGDRDRPGVYPLPAQQQVSDQTKPASVTRRHQATAIGPLLPTCTPSSSPRSVSMMGVNGSCCANQRT